MPGSESGKTRSGAGAEERESASDGKARRHEQRGDRHDLNRDVLVDLEEVFCASFSWFHEEEDHGTVLEFS
ncbi:hypothetical protein H6P81_020259 [Aristolochia fimbriata]|uniref:Uncharacterized protein n=1 Tax=Aristolochia fimbriata TaxID=158543 RepID=A0AAV7DVT8_ARIFI|nr:hypothetical protein H6P81_020259 [Aristolochia fimbriata]